MSVLTVMRRSKRILKNLTAFPLKISRCLKRKSTQHESLSDDLKHALLKAKKNITEFHSREIEQGFVDMDTPGIIRGQKVIPLARVGLYVPGGTAAYPSTIIMTALPAKIAGVKEIIMVTPPQKDGINPAVLGGCKDLPALMRYIKWVVLKVLRLLHMVLNKFQR